MSQGNKKAKDKRNSNPLIKQIHDAVRAGRINEPFTARDIKNWMDRYDIRKGDGTRYAEGYRPATLLANSYIGKRNETNRNSEWLDRHENEDGIFEYWFVEPQFGHHSRA